MRHKPIGTLSAERTIELVTIPAFGHFTQIKGILFIFGQKKINESKLWYLLIM